MCGISGFTGLGYLAAELRYDLVEALGSGIDKRGGHAAGAVAVTDEGPPRLMRKLGSWDGARGRFIRAAGAGHSVMMHARYATHGDRGKVENAHPFAIKRKDDGGKEHTVLYGCHNGILYNADESAKAAGRAFSVDSLEFFELLADKSYETIKALRGYGVVTWIRPEDRKFRLLRLSSSSDLVVYRLQSGGIVWGSTKSIVDDALGYCGLEKAVELDVGKVGQVYLLSGEEATETKLDGLIVNSAVVDRRTSGGYGGSHYSGSSYGSYSGAASWSDPDACCWVCGFRFTHAADCKSNGGYYGTVIPKETIAYNRTEYEARQAELVKAKKEQSKVITVPSLSSLPTQSGKVRVKEVTDTAYGECKDGTFRRLTADKKSLVRDGNHFPIYVREAVVETDSYTPAAGPYVQAFSLSQAAWLSGEQSLQLTTELKETLLGVRTMTAAEKAAATEAIPETQRRPLVGDNGFWSVPAGLSKEDEAEYIRLFKASPALAAKMLDEDEESKLDESLTLSLSLLDD
jgi:hypothetical protein